MDTAELDITLEKMHDSYFTGQALIELRECYTFAWFSFHPAAGLIVWWPIESEIPEPIYRMSSCIYVFNAFGCSLRKWNDGMTNFSTPKEVLILQIMLS